MTKEISTNKVLNTEQFSVKVEAATATDPEKIYIAGYANTKGKADAYGDIPTNFNGNPVYDLERFKQNPVLLINHDNSVDSIAGRFVEIDEDEVGLKFKALLMSNPQTDKVKHAIEAYKQGFGVALSIGGKWIFEDQENPTHLTKALIHEISLVAVGADGNALTEGDRPKGLAKTDGKAPKELVDAIKAYRENPTMGNMLTIEKLKKDGIQK